MRRNNKKGKLPRKRQFTPVLHRKRHTRRSFIRSFCVCLGGGGRGIRSAKRCFAITPGWQTQHRCVRTVFLTENSLPSRSNPFFNYKKTQQNIFVRCVFFGGGRGIRTPVGVNPNGFQDRLVVTASICLRTIKKESIYLLIAKTL